MSPLTRRIVAAAFRLTRVRSVGSARSLVEFPEPAMSAAERRGVPARARRKGGSSGFTSSKRQHHVRYRFTRQEA